jgi:hypothetical protein
MVHYLRPPTAGHNRSPFAMFSDEEVAALLPRLNTTPLQQGSLPTRALVVVNPEPTPYSGPVRFRATFPIRTAVGPRPITVRDASGTVVPSRLIASLLTPRENLPPDKVLWTMELEFVAVVPARGWRSYSSTFGYTPLSRAGDADYWQQQTVAVLSSPPPRVVETECHPGDLPATYSLADAEE